MPLILRNIQFTSDCRHVIPAQAGIQKRRVGIAHHVKDVYVNGGQCPPYK